LYDVVGGLKEHISLDSFATVLELYEVYNSGTYVVVIRDTSVGVHNSKLIL
jgi:hypothetical protein